MGGMRRACSIGLFGALTVVGMVVSSLAATDCNASARARVATMPITLYPEFDVVGTDLPRFLNRQARPGDALVISWREALRGSFTVAQVGLTKAAVWIYVPRDMDLSESGRRHVQGAGGIVYVPEAPGDVGAPAVHAVAQTAEALGCRLIVGLDHQQRGRILNLDALCRPAEILMIYENTLLRAGATAYRAYVARIVQAAREYRPDLKVEVAVATTRDSKSTTAVFDVLLACSDLADRIGVFCDDSAESNASLAQLFELLRGRSDS